MRFALGSVVSFQAFALSTRPFFSLFSLALGAFLATYAVPASAYVGPPAALGMLSLVVGLSMTVIGMVFHWLVKATRHVMRSFSAVPAVQQAVPPVE
jgi:hypothetical protein